MEQPYYAKRYYDFIGQNKDAREMFNKMLLENNFKLTDDEIAEAVYNEFNK